MNGEQNRSEAMQAAETVAKEGDWGSSLGHPLEEVLRISAV